jgi:probable F420-dependent oxidoreductase
VPHLELDRVVAPGETLSIAGIRALAEATESGGWNGLWTSEARHDPFLPLAIAAEHTARIAVGTSIAVAFARSPMTVAHTAWDLQRLSGGRFLLGLGSQVQAHVVRRFGMPWAAPEGVSGGPADRMRDFIQAVRAIWSAWRTGDRLDYRGGFYQHTLMTPFFTPPALDHADPPVYLAAVGPGMTKVAGEVADGVILHGFTTPRYIREVSLPALHAGAAAAGRGPARTAIMAFVVTGEDDEQIASAAQAVREQIGFYGSTPAYRGVMELHGWGEAAEALSGMARRGDWSGLGDVVTDEMLGEFAVVAPIDRVAGAIVDRFFGLVDRLSFYTPYAGADAMWDRVAADVRAHLA